MEVPGYKVPANFEVKVQFDRNALGAGSGLPISPTTDSINGATTSIRGKLLKEEGDWIVLETSTYANEHLTKHILWIPKAKILLLDFALPTTIQAEQGAAANP